MDSNTLPVNPPPSVSPQISPSVEASDFLASSSSSPIDAEPRLRGESLPQTGTQANIEDGPDSLEGKPPQGFWQIFFSTFLTIFLAELGDKTQVTTLLMSAQSQSPWIVFAGAGSALVATSLIGVLLGRWLANRISPKTLDIASGIVLLMITCGLVWDVLHV